MKTCKNIPKGAKEFWKFMNKYALMSNEKGCFDTLNWTQTYTILKSVHVPRKVMEANKKVNQQTKNFQPWAPLAAIGKGLAILCAFE